MWVYSGRRAQLEGLDLMISEGGTELGVINFVPRGSSCCQDCSLSLRIPRKRVCSILYTDPSNYLGLDASCYWKLEGQNHKTRCVREVNN